MVRKISLNKNFLAFLLLTSVILGVFSRLTQTFYQQDEWNGLGLVLSQSLQSVFPETFRPIDLLFVKGRMLSSLIFYFFASNFPLQNVQMAVLAIILHIIATFLVFLLIKRTVRSFTASLLGAAFFAVNSVSHGAVTWPVIAISTIGSSIFILLSILSFFKFAQTDKTKWLLLTGFLLYTSLWFKETGLYLFIFFPFAVLLLRRYKIKAFLKQFWWFILLFFLIAGYRVLELRSITTSADLYLTGASENFFLTLLIRAGLYPLTSLSLMFVPGNHFIEFAREVVHNNYPYFAGAPNFVLIAQSAILDILALALTIFILFVIFLFLRREKSGIIKTVTFWLAFSLLSFIPYVVLAKDFSYLESRYYYVPVAGGAFLLAWVLQRFRQIVGKIGFTVLIVPLTVLFLWWHIKTVHVAISDQVLLSQVRKSFMVQLKEQLPTLNAKKNIFYITSDKNYWADTNMLPFQQGSGYTLMVLYYGSDKIPNEFLKDGFLFEIGSQGYRDDGDLVFGFFYDKKELTKAMETYKLSEDDIVYLNYKYKEKKITVSK